MAKGTPDDGEGVAGVAGSRPGAVVLGWSGGKDSSLALWRLQAQGVAVRGLLTTVTETFDRVSMHGVRESLLAAQGASLGLPITRVKIPSLCPNEVYEARMGEAVQSLIAGGVDAFAFGDLFLADIRAYREEALAPTGARAIFPLWLEDTAELARTFVQKGFRAVIVTVDPKKLDPSFAGRQYDAQLLADLPTDVDPCGENGEFHTFVYDGPPFSRPIDVVGGEVVARGGFIFADLVPAGS